MKLIGNRYRLIEELGAGAMGTVSLAFDRLTAQTVALKQVALSPHNPPDELDRLRIAVAREFKTLASLRHPNIVGVLDYGFHQRQPYFTMEYLPDAKPMDDAAIDLPRTTQVGMLVQLLQALVYLHRRGILHRDLKPENVLVTANGTVKVLDFGLAKDVQTVTEDATVGTMGYIAPELLQQLPPSIASDLYAFGVMAAQVLTGRYPFDSRTPVRLMVATLEGIPDLKGLDDGLAAVLHRLLMKDPVERYQNALDVMRDLCEATGLPAPAETHEHRESFLRAAAFVGRDAEIETLLGALRQAGYGKGSLWIVGGESGVGKSRLLEELRTRALVEGLQVLRGQAVEGGGLPYQLWREPVRRLVLGTALDSLSASILKEIVPDIGTLLGCEVPDAPPLDAKHQRERLTYILLDVLRAQKQPLVILLEDLQWTVESLDVLKTLYPFLSALPVLIIGTYRSDETPDLPFEGAQTLLLDRLSPREIAALSESMLGKTEPHVVDFLARETEGNALFMVEVVRALAEEAGSLVDIGHKTLPEQLLVGGVRQILRRRVGRVPVWAQGGLKFAAVVGRAVDLRAMPAVITGVESWLWACADAAVLEPVDGVWRFAHDKLRETLLEDVPADELKTLHRKAAETLESLYPDNVAYAEALAEHWRAAGEVDKEIEYILKAARHMESVTAEYLHAEILLRRALAYNRPLFEEKLKFALGIALDALGQVEEALPLFKDLLTAEDPKLRVNAMSRLSYMYYINAAYADGMRYAEQALAEAEQHGDWLGKAYALKQMGSIYTYTGNYARAHEMCEQSKTLYEQYGNPYDVSIVVSNQGILHYYLGEYAQALACSEFCINYWIEVGNRTDLSNMYANLGNIAWVSGDFAKALRYYEEGCKVARQHSDPYGILMNLGNLGLLAYTQGDFDYSRRAIEESLTMARRLGFQRSVSLNLNGLGILEMLLGNTRAALPHLTESLQISREADAPYMIVAAGAELVICHALLDDKTSARTLLVDVLDAAKQDRSPATIAHALLAAASVSDQPEVAARWLAVITQSGMLDPEYRPMLDKVRVLVGEVTVEGELPTLEAVFDGFDNPV